MRPLEPSLDPSSAWGGILEGHGNRAPVDDQTGMRLDQVPCALLANEGISCCEGIAQGAAVAGLMPVGRNHLYKAALHQGRGQRLLRALAPAGQARCRHLGPRSPSHEFAKQIWVLMQPR